MILFIAIFLTLAGGQHYRFVKDQIVAWGPPVAGFDTDHCRTVMYMITGNNYCVREELKTVDDMLLGVKHSDLPPR